MLSKRPKDTAMTASTDSAELAGLLQKTPLTRRTMLMSTLSVGFAAAVQPVTAQTLTTDTAGLEAGEVKIPTADGEIPAYRAMPATAGPHATVLVVQEIFGPRCRSRRSGNFFALRTRNLFLWTGNFRSGRRPQLFFQPKFQKIGQAA
jgi:hypothetical protein